MLEKVRTSLSGVTTPLIVIIIVAVSFVRLYYCLHQAIFSQDMIRNIYYGEFVKDYGLKVAASPLMAFSAKFGDMAFSDIPYQYPVISLLFFTLLSFISPSAFLVKISLTLIEAVNSLLLYRLTKDRFLALLYWAAPLSIIWASQEGQFEPLQNLFVFAAFMMITRSSFWSFLLLALAVQVKISAILLLPWFIFRLHKDKKLSVTVLSGFLTGFIPSLIAQLFFPSLQQIFTYSHMLLYNPYYWNFGATGIFTFRHAVFMPFNQIFSYGIVVVLIVFAVRSRAFLAYLAPLLFMLICKLHHNVNFWYPLVLPALLMPVEDRKQLRILFLLWIMLDFASVVEIFRAFGGDGLLCRFMDVSKLDRLRVPYP